MKKLILLFLYTIPFIIQADQRLDLQSQLTITQTELKLLQDEVLLYNQSQPILQNAKQLIDNNTLIVKNITIKIEDLTGVTSANGTTTFNNNPKSNKALNDEITKLQHQIDDLTSQNTLIDNSIVTARATLGSLRTKTQTADILQNIKFYQDKIAEYLKNKDTNNAIIQKNRNTINDYKSTIALNDEQIKTYQNQIDAAKKIIADNQALIDSTNAKLAATQDKININNITTINNKIAKLQDTINSLNNQIINLPATPTT